MPISRYFFAQDVGAVTRAVHPGFEHEIGSAVIPYILGAVTVAVALAADALARADIGAFGGVGEVVSPDHVSGMGAGGLLQVRVNAERPQVTVPASAVVQREGASLLGVQEDSASPALGGSAMETPTATMPAKKIETNKTARYFTITSPPPRVCPL